MRDKVSPTYESGSESNETRLPSSSSSAALLLRLSVVRRLMVRPRVLSSLLFTVPASDDGGFLRRRFTLMAFGRSFPRPLPSMLLIGHCVGLLWLLLAFITATFVMKCTKGKEVGWMRWVDRYGVGRS